MKLLEKCFSLRGTRRCHRRPDYKLNGPMARNLSRVCVRVAAPPSASRTGSFGSEADLAGQPSPMSQPMATTGQWRKSEASSRIRPAGARRKPASLSSQEEDRPDGRPSLRIGTYLRLLKPAVRPRCLALQLDYFSPGMTMLPPPTMPLLLYACPSLVHGSPIGTISCPMTMSQPSSSKT